MALNTKQVMDECSKICLTVFPCDWHVITVEAHLTVTCDHTLSPYLSFPSPFSKKKQQQEKEKA